MNSRVGHPQFFVGLTFWNKTILFQTSWHRLFLCTKTTKKNCTKRILRIRVSLILKQEAQLLSHAKINWTVLQSKLTNTCYKACYQKYDLTPLLFVPGICCCVWWWRDVDTRGDLGLYALALLLAPTWLLLFLGGGLVALIMSATLRCFSVISARLPVAGLAFASC